MCGRTACTLCKEDFQRAVQQYSSKKKLPEWIQKYSWQHYSPNYNVSPSQISPVLIMEDVFDHKLKDSSIVLCPMRWGLVPHWYSGALKEYSLKTNNCRLESILEKPTYKHSLINGRRCVILADGFYEWKTADSGKKQPYFIHFPEENGVKVCNRTWENESFLSETNEWKGPRLLTMAGIFDVWNSHEFGELYSYSVITMDSSKTMSSIHHRMPAILDGEDEVKMWLNSKTVPHDMAIEKLKAVENLEFYALSSEVNNSRNNSANCIKPIKETSKGLSTHKTEEASLKQNTLMSWLKRDPQPLNDNQNKRMKLNN